MRVLVQRVSEAAVTVEGRVVGAIGPGLLALVGVTHADTVDDAETLAAKMARLRVFRDHAGKMNRSVRDVDGAVLVVSQFTLYGDTRRGNRPSFTEAAGPDHAIELVDRLVAGLVREGISVATGRFGAMMDVALVNDGPVTLMLEATDGRLQ